MRESVSFLSNGSKIAGHIYRPKVNDGVAAAIVLLWVCWRKRDVTARIC